MVGSRYQAVRQRSIALAEPLSAEDCAIQSMPDASPVKWHLAHTTWFFETFVLKGKPFNAGYGFLFNSYYNAIGERHPRPERGMLSRPSLEEVLAYRKQVDDAIARLGGDARLIELGLQHEQQHQELMLTDLKHLLSRNPLKPAYQKQWPLTAIEAREPGRPRRRGLLLRQRNAAPPRVAGRLRDGLASRHPRRFPGVHRRRRLSSPRAVAFGGMGCRDGARLAGAALLGEARWRVAPFHAARRSPRRSTHTGLPRELLRSRCVRALCRARLPTEAEWEVAARDTPLQGNFVESGALHPLALREAPPAGKLAQAFGDVWEWTRSDYAPYPGYQPAAGAIGEYNGKFMSGQYVLRGGSCATPASHIRATYRNFFPPEARWQFSGLRLARTPS
jgi:hypothetical protein